MGKKVMGNGSRVEIVDGVFCGEKATIVPSPEIGEWFEDGWVWIRFDNDGAMKGGGVLNQQWFDPDHFRLI